MPLVRALDADESGFDLLPREMLAFCVVVASTPKGRVRIGSRNMKRRTLFTLGLLVLAAACEPKRESPFEARGLRAGMNFIDLSHRTVTHDSDWRSAPLAGSVRVFDRTMQPERANPRAARLEVVVDTSDNRVLELHYTPIYNVADTAALNAELTALATKWDEITDGARDQRSLGPHPYTITWISPDGAWTGQIFYSVLPLGFVARPNGFAINERKWRERILARIAPASRNLR